MGEWKGEVGRTRNTYWLSNRMVEEMPNWSSHACFDCAKGSPLSPFFPERFEDVSVLLTSTCVDYFEDQVRR